MSEKPRYIWIDYAKFISIFLVVSYHCQPALPSYLGEMLRLLRMPAFFLISGFLFNENKFPTYKSFFKHRSKQLLIPYFYFSCFFYILWLLIGNKFGNPEDINAKFYEPIIEFIIGRPTLIIHPFWFICCLFSIQTIYYFLIHFFKKKNVLIICLFLPFINNITNYTELPFEIDMAFKYIPFYAISNYLKNKILYIAESDRKNNYLVIILLIIFLFTFHFYIENNNLYIETILCTLLGISILPVYIIFCYNISKFCKQQYFIEYIGKNSIVILAIQTYIIKVIEFFIFKFTYQDFFVSKYYLNFSMTLLVIILSYYPIVIINKYFPFIIGKSK